jgi:hypothetical protein
MDMVIVDVPYSSGIALETASKKVDVLPIPRPLQVSRTDPKELTYPLPYPNESGIEKVC